MPAASVPETSESLFQVPQPELPLGHEATLSTHSMVTQAPVAERMVDVEGGNNMMYLPLDKIVSQSKVSRSAEDISPTVIREISNRVADQLRRDRCTGL